MPHPDHKRAAHDRRKRGTFTVLRCRYCDRIGVSHATRHECVECFHAIACHLDPGTVPTREAIAAAVCSCHDAGGGA